MSKSSSGMLCDAVEAHSCVEHTDAKFFIEQNTTVNDKSTAGRFDPKVFVNCVQDDSTQLTKTFGLKRPAVVLSLTVVFCSIKNLASVCFFYPY